MPTISRARIVNFYYNENKRFIPDVTFDFDDSEGNTLDTLLDLENGGGKTVLVQLFLQPIIPGAKVQTRKISDYFRKSSDCTYILLEWKLDRSTDHLLTGIAMTSSQSSNESEENRTVKYFTFINHYGRGGDKYDINKFPLSEKENGRFSAMQFEKVRAIAKNLEYYHSDDVKKYQSRLDEFGIIHSEWENILVKINEREGGIEKFIEEYNTTDKLIDRFIIPGITASRTAGDADGETVDMMFMNYAESCSQKSEKIEQRKRIGEFIGRLNEFVPQEEQLWYLYDECQKSIRQLFDYIISLKAAISTENTRFEQLSSDKKAAEEEKLHIELEKLSDIWYRDTESKENETRLKEEFTQKADKAKLWKQSAEHNLKVLRAAEKYGYLTECMKKQAELQTQLRKLTDDNFDGYIRSVRYSLYTAAKTLSNESEKRLVELSKQIEDNSAVINAISEKHKVLLAEQKDLRSKTDRMYGQRNQLDSDISKGLAKLNISIAKKLDNSYDTTDIEYTKQQFVSDIKAMECEAEKLSEKNRQIGGTFAENQNKEKELNIEKNQLENKLNTLKAEISEYDEKFREVCEVLRSLSMSEVQAFTDLPKNELNMKIAELNEDIKACERKTESLSEQRINAEKGNVHIPQSAVDFIDNVGVDYQTGTAYLLEHGELCGRILDIEPLVAFSVIVNDEKSRQDIYNSVDYDSCISAAIPILTLAEISAAAEGKKSERTDLLTAYSHGYFKDKTSYILDISERIEKKNTELKLLQEKLAEREKQLAVVCDFWYSENYISDKINEQVGVSDRLDKLNEEINFIEENNHELSKRREFIIERSKELSEEIAKHKQLEIRFDEICGKMDEYYSVLDTFSKNEKQLFSVEKQLDTVNDDLNEANKHSEELKRYKELASEKKKEYLQTAMETECEAAELLNDDYETLKAAYDKRTTEINKDKRELNDELEQNSKKAANLQIEIDKIGISKEEYSKTDYSEEAVSREETAKKEADEEWTNAVEQKNKHEVESNHLSRNLEKIERRISDLGRELLPMSEIGSNFDERIGKCLKLTEDIVQNISDVKSKISTHKAELDRSEKIARKRKYNDNSDTHHIIEIFDNQSDDILGRIDECEKNLQKAESDARNWIMDNLGKYSEYGVMFKNIIGQLIGFIDNETENDKYFTMNEKLKQDIQTLEKQINRLNIELKDIESSKNELVSNCMQRIKVLYDDLKSLAKKSSVNIFEQNKQMIRIDLPEIVQDDNASKTRMEQYIESSVKEYLKKYDENDIRAREQSANNFMNYRRLLNVYIGKDEINVSVYKIGNTVQTSSYRKWENALKENSGGERFVVFFALVLSMMNFSRSIFNSMNDTSGVMILDNPFGPISSAHLLNPMFAIARKFRIQLICFTHLDTAEIVKCFRNSYKLKLKARPLSSIETLEAEPLQELEHAFYRAEQLSLF